MTGIQKNKWALSLLFVLLLSCGSTNSIDRFYELHKNDNEVLAVRVPQSMLSLLSGISPELQNIIGNTRDIRFMRFSGLSTPKIETLSNQMNNITSSSFIEVYRKNQDEKRSVISIREKRDLVKEIMIFNHDDFNANLLYFNGEFDPARVRSLAENEQFNDMSETLFSQFSGPVLIE
ncbi:MAG: DUF4252 domain-containing protein [Flavobacteriaceae bacterium]